MILLLLGMNLPFFWMVSTSLKAPKEVFTYPPKWFPETPILENYINAWNAVPFARYIFNTLVVALAKMSGHVFFGILAAYAFAKMRFRGAKFIFYLFLSTMMIPGEVNMVPGFIIIRAFGWIDTYRALIIPGLTDVFAIFLLRQFFLSIPRDLDDAAKIDGCGRFRYVVQVIVPLSKPVIFTVILFSFLATWNDFLGPLIYTNSESMRVVQVGIAVFQTKFAYDYAELMAATTMVTLPVIIVFLFVQRHFIEGITMSGMKA
jgi:multiple sugar transport system permease protein